MTTTTHGFTSDTLGWRAWLDTVSLDAATPDQLAVLEASHPQAKTSDYYLLLVHLPEILRQRSGVFNAIMYGPGGLSRGTRTGEHGRVARERLRVLRVRACAALYPAREAHRRDRAGVRRSGDGRHDARERAIIRYAIALTERPDTVDAGDIAALEAEGLTHEEILDLSHAVAIFAWANRLMLTLGEPVFPEPATSA